MKFALRQSCACLALTVGVLAPTSAFAQDTAPSPVEDEQAAADPNVIVVTAQGRAQALADVPVAISAVSAETLQNSGANDIRQLNQVAPSLLVSSTGTEANASPRIRGIGTVGDNPGLESSVVVFIDGVYRSRSGIGLNELGEIDRVEVLRGPQGTLGGRNSSAGLISIISKQPSFSGFSAGAEATYGNYDYLRLAGNVNVPIGDTIAARVDGVFVQRDGFYRDPANDTRVNDRDRYFIRGQLRFEPTDALNIRIIGDYTNRDESCCGAVYVDRSVNPFIGNLNEPVPLVNAGVGTFGNGNNIINVMRDLGQDPAAFNSGYRRVLSVTPGRTYGGKTEDWGISGQVDWDFGGIQLTSITAYRDYYAEQAGDIDYSSVDILYNAADGNNRRAFKTFTQEIRLNGTAFNDRLDWLVGGFFADEKFRGRSNLRFGADYGRFATCRAVSGGSLAAFYSPTGQGCLSATGRALLPSGALAGAGISAAVGTALLGAFDRLDSVRDRGSTVDNYRQDSTSFAAFTHNIFHVTDTVDLTLGLRYTNEKKKFSATFGNDNVACTAQQAALTPFLTTPLAATAGGLISLTCQGNSTAELNGVSIADERKEDEFTGTAILSWKPVDDLLVYGSYSRGYKAGGFNFDRSALKSPVLPFAAFGGGNSAAGAQALVGSLQFDPETVNAYEIGAKYSTGPFTFGIAAFRQEFSNFQLNTFDGTVFIVQNVNGCSNDLGGADRDQSKFVGAPNYNAGAAASGACNPDDVTYGVLSQGVELEAQFVPARDLRIAMGLTYADTSYRDDLVGTEDGAPLNQALRKLPGDNLSNAPEITTTASVAFTPAIGSSGMSALFYIDGRMTGDYNTGSDLFPQKEQDGFATFNARVGLRGPDDRWAIELWGQNIFNKDYAQVAFNSPFQEGAVSTTAAFADPQYPGGRQIFSQFLAEPRTYGVTLRTNF
ncbi:TonB-dependent receptor [Altererythrobacter aerius]|uniref:TonB-dependent receptor n=1 Tax=Tsuneonella aeria TaxID=1837929 RepID=A0A6I4TDP9_9SPHN|nr:TonB-dependent receptor [Tsuneonella aeria]MXO74280.1 TonB-dependent receptor [Tsuneonella aeria]